MKPLRGVVARLLRTLGLETDVARAAALKAWPDAAARVIGPDAARTRAVRVEEETLVVAVPTVAWAAEIRLRQGPLVEALRRAAPGSGIRRIRSVPTPERTNVQPTD